MNKPAIEVNINETGSTRAITLHARHAKNGFIGAFANRHRRFEFARDEGAEIVATAPGTFKRLIMAEFEARLDAEIAEMKAQAKTDEAAN